MNYVGRNLIKYVQDLYKKSYKMMNKIKVELNKWNNMFMDRKIPYCQDIRSSKLDL